MKVPERNDRPVGEAPAPLEGAEVPPVFQRTFQYPRVFLFIAVAIGYVLSMMLLLIAAIGFFDGEFMGISVVFGLFGLGVLAASVKGSWSFAKGPRVYFLTLEPAEVVWGSVGDERCLAASEIASIHYAVDTDSDSSNDLTLSFKTHAGERIPIRHVNLLVPRKVRPKLLAFLKANYPVAKLLISE